MSLREVEKELYDLKKKNPDKTGSRRFPKSSKSRLLEETKSKWEEAEISDPLRRSFSEASKQPASPELQRGEQATRFAGASARRASNKEKFKEESKTEDETTEKIGIYSRALFWILIAGIIAVGGFAYYYIFHYQNNRELGFEVLIPENVASGEPFEVAINLENKSQSVLREPKISIKFPETAAFLGDYPQTSVIEEKIDDIGVGDLISKKYKFAFVSGGETGQKFVIVFSYLPGKLNTRFEASKSVEISVNEPAISIGVVAPQKVFNREVFELSVNYQNVSDYLFKKARLELELPKAFSLKESSVKSTSGFIWNLGDLEPDKQDKIVVKGSIEAPDQSFFNVKSKLYAEIEGKEFLISEKSAGFGIAASPLSLLISVNDGISYAATNENLNYQIKYRNNTSETLNDAMISVKLKGEMFDFKTLKTQGIFDPSINKISWSAADNSQLRALPPSAEGVVSFSIKTLVDFPIKRMFDKNFILEIQAEISSPTVPASISSDRTVGVASNKIKIAGRAEFANFFEKISTSSLRANEPVVYDIHWQIKNYSTDIKDVKVSGFLQYGSKWLNIVSSNIDATSTYNGLTGEVSWNIPKILATKGVISKPAEAVFRVEIMPPSDYIGLKLPILGETSFSATDDFTGLNLSLKSSILQTFEQVLPPLSGY